jgi:hypothetical protein
VLGSWGRGGLGLVAGGVLPCSVGGLGVLGCHGAAGVRASTRARDGSFLGGVGRSQ